MCRTSSPSFTFPGEIYRRVHFQGTSVVKTTALRLEWLSVHSDIPESLDYKNHPQKRPPQFLFSSVAAPSWLPWLIPYSSSAQGPFNVGILWI